MADDDNVISFAAKRALDGEGDVTKWQPRDMLEYYIKMIDAGQKFDGMALIYSLNDPVKKQTMTGIMRSQFSVTQCLGVMECVKYDMLASTDV